MEVFLKNFLVKALLDNMKKERKQKLIVVAQTPPPYLGQSIMHKFFVDDKWNEIDKKHIRLKLTNKSDQFGKFSLAKILGVLKLISQIWQERLKGKIDAIYYPPSGPVNKKTFYKDLSILLFTRFLAEKTIFHFHADKFDNLLNVLNEVELFFAEIIYGNPDLCIVILEPQKLDVSWLNPNKVVVIPNGIEDSYTNIEITNTKCKPFGILYIGLLVEYKGIEDAITASAILKMKGLDFKWVFVGGWSSVEFKNKINLLIEYNGLQDNMIFVGEKIEKEKWKYFSEANVLCLPTRKDLMPLCILEGMMMSLPIVSTRLRTIPHIVDEGVNGLLSEVNDPKSLSENLEYLLNNKAICEEYGINARNKFENEYKISNHLKLMKSEILKTIKVKI